MQKKQTTQRKLQQTQDATKYSRDEAVTDIHNKIRSGILSTTTSLNHCFTHTKSCSDTMEKGSNKIAKSIMCQKR
eukprot:10635585-Ditylum_brightwellii.AAC.1